MKYSSLIWSSMFRRKMRTVLTLLSIIVAFLLFGLLHAVHEAFSGGVNAARADRMITNSKYSIIDTLPIAYQKQIEAVPGVKAVAFATWFGGSYQNKPVQFAVYPVVPDEYLRASPELQISAATMSAWRASRTGAVVEDTLADRMNWKVGDKVPLQADIWPQADGSLTWTLDIVGTFYNTKGQASGTSTVLFRYDYFDEARQYGKGTVGWFQVALDEPNDAARVGRMIDSQFSNSEHETKTQTEQAFAQGFAKQFGDIALMVTAVLGAVFFTLIVLTGNTMSQAVRERVPELGILKTLGFSDATVCALVMLESVSMALLGAIGGLLLAAIVLRGLEATLSSVGIAGIGWMVVVEGIVIATLLGLCVGLLPALMALRLKIVDALIAS